MFNDIQKIMDTAFEKTETFKTIKVTEGEPQKEFAKIFTVSDFETVKEPYDHTPFRKAFRRAFVSLLEQIVNTYKMYKPQSIDQPGIDTLRDFMVFSTPNGVRFFFKELPDTGNGSAYVLKTFLSIGPRGEAKKNLFENRPRPAAYTASAAPVESIPVGWNTVRVSTTDEDEKI